MTKPTKPERKETLSQIMLKRMLIEQAKAKKDLDNKPKS